MVARSLTGGDRAITKRRLLRLLAAAAMVGWAAYGVHGSVVYGSNYYVFRGFPAPRHPPGVPAGRLVHVRFFSRALAQRRFYYIYLPPRYSQAAARGRRFPVFYFLHGCPGTPKLIYDAGRIGVEYDVLLHRHSIKPFLMVMPDGRIGTFRSDTEWADTVGAGHYGGFVLDVVHAVDRRWATIPKRKDRMIAGNSEGGYGALNLSLHHLGTFGSLESWSGYVEESAVTGPFAGEPLSTVEANEPTLYLPHVAKRVKHEGLRAYLTSGSHDGSRFQSEAYVRELRSAGGKANFSLVPGGHDWHVWRRETPQMLLWASRTLGR